MGYSTEENVVRVDIFKPSGKWMTDIALTWTGGWSKDTTIHSAFEYSLKSYRKDFYDHFEGCTVVCLEPYHELSPPIWLHTK